ncbi:MAG: hypothetical protein AB7S26_24100 [Sandaracinaceae bacterium]
MLRRHALCYHPAIDLTTVHRLGLERYREGWSGRTHEHGRTSAWLATLGDPLADAWRRALDAQAWFADPGSAAFPVVVADLAGMGGSPEVDEVLGHVCALGEREAVLRFDASGLDAWLGLHRRLGARAWLAAGEAWRSWSFGHPLEVDLARTAAEARDLQDAPLAIETAALEALFAASRGDVDTAVRVARRASRMARTEALPQPQYLANLVLARVRRIAGRPHLSVHILNALLRVAPRAWWPWMSWERALAGGDGEGWSAPPARAVIELARAALAGRPTEVERALGALGALRHVAAFAPEIDALGALVDPRYPVPPALRAWFDGAVSDNTPYGLHELCNHHPDQVIAGEPVWVIAGPGNARRVLAIGLPLVGVARLDPGRRRKGRTDAAIAQLVLGGDEEEEAFFARLYGFPYHASVHRGARDTLYTRIRERVRGHATLRREGGRLGLDVHGWFAFPDPRCAPPPENAILAILARVGASTAKEAADALGLPVRTAQHALKALADEGVCRVEKDGKQLRYHVEDTTFVEPTTQ